MLEKIRVRRASDNKERYFNKPTSKDMIEFANGSKVYLAESDGIKQAIACHQPEINISKKDLKEYYINGLRLSKNKEMHNA